MLHCSPFAACFNPAAGEKEQGLMASSKQTTMKLYWVSSHDHDHDWFIFAESASAARAYHEQYEGYNQGEARSRLIVSHVTLKEFMNGDPPCNAKFEDLYRIGFEGAGAVKHRVKAGLTERSSATVFSKPSSSWEENRWSWCRRTAADCLTKPQH